MIVLRRRGGRQMAPDTYDADGLVREVDARRGGEEVGGVEEPGLLLLELGHVGHVLAQARLDANLGRARRVQALALEE